MPLLIPLPGETLIDAARRCDALYICPKDGDGNRIGDLVIYAGISKEDGLNYVGDIYFNFRKIERHLPIVRMYADVVCDAIIAAGAVNFDVVCGIPEGGRTLGQEIASRLGKEFVYPKKVPIDTPSDEKQKYSWDFGDFGITPGTRLAIVDDILNNLQNTDTTLGLIAAAGGIPTTLLSALNRSPHVRHSYTPDPAIIGPLPIFAAINKPYPEFSQTDAAVAADIAAGKLERKVKPNWARLMRFMDEKPAA